MLRRTLTAAVATAVVAVLPAAAHAAKPTKPTAAASTPIVLNESAPHLGGTVTFTVDAPRIKSPRVAVRCYQGGAMTYAEAGPADSSFLLGGGASAWLTAGGEADCTAELFWIDWTGAQQQFNTLGWTSFHAGA